MSDWGRRLDDLAAAVTDLLLEGVVRTTALVDPHAALAARDNVLVELRALVGALADVPQFTRLPPLTLHDAVHRPAQALHQALSELPRATSFGEVDLPAVDDSTLPGYERTWQRAARASLSLEIYIDALSQLPDSHAWKVLRDLTDLAAALPYLDHDLSEALLPQLHSSHQLSAPYQALTHTGHNALRLVSTEIRSRLPAHPAPPPTGAGSTSRGEPGLDRTGQLAEAMTRYTHAISARSAHLSVPDLRAASRLLETGSRNAADVLDRSAPAITGAADIATGLRAVAQRARQLRDAPATSMTPAHLDQLRASTDLQATMTALAALAHQLPDVAAEPDLRLLAGPALEFTQHLPALASALEVSVREALAAKLLLIPGIADPRSTTAISWITVTMGPRQDGPPAVVTRAGDLAVTARRLAPASRLAAADLGQHTATPANLREQATIAARQSACAARDTLRRTLTERTTSHPAVLAGDLPSHPRSAPPPTARTNR